MGLLLRRERPPGGLNLSSATLASFDTSGFVIHKILGPGSLIRLVDGSRYMPSLSSPGEFWMDEEDYLKARGAAYQDLKSQGHGDRADLIGLHSRYQMRDGLAVSRDWSNLDRFIRLNLPFGKTIFAHVGRTRTQPYYSSAQPGDQARAAAAGVSLPGMGQQIVIDFAHPSNAGARQYISGPYLF